LVLDRGRLLDAVGVIQEHAEIADAADAGLRTHGRLADFDTREAEDALLRLTRRPVVIDLLVGAARDAHAPAATALLVDQNDAVLFALVDGAGGTGGQAGRVQAVLAQPGQVHHEGVFELAVDLLLDALEIIVLRPLGELSREVVLPVAAPFDLGHHVAGDQRARPGRGLGLQLRRLLQPVVFEGVRLVEVVDLGQVRVGEQLGQDAPLRADSRLDLAVLLPDPAALPALLVLPVLGVADARLGLDVIEPGVFDPLAVGPDVLAGDRTGVTANAFVQVQDHGDLSADLHSAASRSGSAALSNQLIALILRMTTNSSRLAPTVP